MAQSRTEKAKVESEKPQRQATGNGTEITKLRDLLARQEATRQSC